MLVKMQLLQSIIGFNDLHQFNVNLTRGVKARANTSTKSYHKPRNTVMQTDPKERIQAKAFQKKYEGPSAITSIIVYFTL